MFEIEKARRNKEAGIRFRARPAIIVFKGHNRTLKLHR